ncbi:MAG: rRNA pseudouridine synthase [Bdellovibrionales bacterium]|jgi:23S rRNA pseudouridine2605 synthase|nr:rRNA pseudouridine synthase [Bdellovibrionales bacterium]
MKKNQSADSSANSVRLQKYIADCGLTSRRKAEDLIVQGRVRINNEIVTVLGVKVDPRNDVVAVDGDVLDHKIVKNMYVLLHKPRGYMTTISDPEGRRTVMDLCKEVTERIYPVGRLDYLSEGLLLLTNDGNLANLVMHPRFNVTKVYEVKVFGAVSLAIQKRLREGVELDDGFVKPFSVRVIKQLPTKTWLEFRLKEGRNREIRRICEACGLTVDKLKRVAIEGLTIDGIKPGGYRFVTKKFILDALNMKEDGTSRNKSVKTYFSNKKSINLRKRKLQDTSLADNEGFHALRREKYFDSLKEISSRKKEKAEAERLKIKLERQLKYPDKNKLDTLMEDVPTD